MPLSVRERILQRIVALIGSINSGSVYEYALDLGDARVHRNRGVFGTDEIPAACIWDTDEEQRDNAIYGRSKRIMSIQIDTVTKIEIEATGSILGNTYAAEIEYAILHQYDAALNELIDGIECTGIAIAAVQPGSRAIGVTVSFNITFTTQRGDPFVVAK